MSSLESHVVGTPSPHKKHGSFLQRASNVEKQNSPRTFMKVKANERNESPARVRRQLRVDDESNDVCTSSANLN